MCVFDGDAVSLHSRRSPSSGHWYGNQLWSLWWRPDAQDMHTLARLAEGQPQEPPKPGPEVSFVRGGGRKEGGMKEGGMIDL